MNDPEVIMLVPPTGLAVYRKALEAAGRAMTWRLLHPDV